ncbi:MAG: proline dehydrogenase family protein [Gemmatimonadales bacterium]|jgi:proline dehydrogenase
MGITREVLLRGSRSRWLADQLTRRSFTRRAVRRFMPGESIDDALAAADGLHQKGMGTILTLLGENISRADEAETVVRHYLGSLAQIEARGFDSDISIKPTQLGLDLDYERTYERYEKLVGRAGELGRMIAVDMEDSSYVDRTLELYRRLREDHANVTLCLQAYLYRTASDLESLLPLAPAIRLVKGAYKEPRELAYRRKNDVDANFLTLAEVLLQARKRDPGVRVFFGTHDTQLLDTVFRRAAALDLPKDAFEVQVLYGIQRAAQIQLAAEGYPVRVLISYGDSWFPWYMRRLAERPANVSFLLKNLVSR